MFSAPFFHSLGAQVIAVDLPHLVGIPSPKQAKQSIMFPSFKLVAITVLLFAPLDTLAGRIYHRDEDPQMSLSKFHESQHLLNLVLISWLRQPSIPRLSNPPASSLAWKTVGIPTRMPH